MRRNLDYWDSLVTLSLRGNSRHSDLFNREVRENHKMPRRQVVISLEQHDRVRPACEWETKDGHVPLDDQYWVAQDRKNPVDPALKQK